MLRTELKCSGQHSKTLSLYVIIVALSEFRRGEHESQRKASLRMSDFHLTKCTIVGDFFLFKYYLGHKYQAPQVRPNRGSNSWPPDHDCTFHVTEMAALTTRPSVTSPAIMYTVEKSWHHVYCTVDDLIKSQGILLTRKIICVLLMIKP